MKIVYHAPFSINNHLKGLIKNKVEKLQQNSRPLLGVDVYFKLKNGPKSINDKELELKVLVPGQVIFGVSYADTFEKAIPDVTEKVRRQLERHMAQLDPKRK
jgi:Sigma 54 modulation protein / S30EA ribosomal protein.